MRMRPPPPPLCLFVFGFLHLCLVFVFREVGIVACSGALRCARSPRGLSCGLFKVGIVLLRPRPRFLCLTLHVSRIQTVRSLVSLPRPSLPALRAVPVVPRVPQLPWLRPAVLPPFYRPAHHTTQYKTLEQCSVLLYHNPLLRKQQHLA